MTALVEVTPRVKHPWVAEHQERIGFGTSIYPQPADWGEFMRIVQRTEELGFDSYWAYDHPTARADCWTALTALAMATGRIRLGTMVGCIYYRGAFLLARMAADVDRLSGGRLILGLGIGDNVPEFESLGIPFPSTAERQEAMAETIEVVRRLWADERFVFDGRQVSARGTFPFHPPVQQPHVPLLLAGGGERVTLRQVARFADASNFGSHAWNGSAFTTEDVTRKYEALRRHCEELDRPYDHILRSHFTMPLILVEREDQLAAKLSRFPKETLEFCASSLVAGTPEQAIAYYRSLADCGVQYFVANILDGDGETTELLGSAVMPAFVEGRRQEVVSR